MAVYYKFRSAKDFDSIPVGLFISVFDLKQCIFETKRFGHGKDFDLIVTNAQTNQEYHDEAMLIPRNTSVIIRRVPGLPQLPVVIDHKKQKVEPSKCVDPQPTKISFVGAELPAAKYPEDLEDFGDDLFAIPEVIQAHSPTQDAPPPSKDDEHSKIKALVDTPALDWRQTSNGFGPGRGFGQGNGRMMTGCGFGQGGLERKTPPQGYVCHRCKVPGHFIQHCPTNGDHTYDIKRVKPPTVIPKSILQATPDGSYALLSGAVAVLKPNEAAFEKEIKGLPSTGSVDHLPPELYCPLCKQVMKDAAMTSKCCFKSFCDKCIRDHIISKSVCFCGANDILADDLIPNKTLRDTINRILESKSSSSATSGITSEAQDMESKISKNLSPIISATSKRVQVPTPSKSDEVSMVKENFVNVPQNSSKKGNLQNVAYASEATYDLISRKAPSSQGSVPLADKEQQKPVSGEAGKENRKRKVSSPLDDAEIYILPA